MRTRSALPAAVLALSLALTACGSSDDTEKEGAADASQTVQAKPDTWPLTGLPSGGKDEQTHPIYIAKIDNTEASDPQIGLGSADLITEELVEGGLTRLAVFYYSQLPTKVGPVRSMRLTDIGVAKPAGATIVTSGAAPVTLKGLKKAGITFADMSNPAVVRVSDGQHDSLHSVMANLKQLAKSSKQKQPERPDDFLPFGETDFSSGKAAGNIDVQFSGGNHTRWKFSGGHYEMQDSHMAKGDEFQPDTVVTCYVKTSTAPYKDPAGNPVPVSHFRGKGKALIFHDGKVLKGTWVKSSDSSAVTFKTASGDELDIPAGKTFLELVPHRGSDATGKVSFTK